RSLVEQVVDLSLHRHRLLQELDGLSLNCDAVRDASTERPERGEVVVGRFSQAGAADLEVEQVEERLAELGAFRRDVAEDLYAAVLEGGLPSDIVGCGDPGFNERGDFAQLR